MLAMLSACQYNTESHRPVARKALLNDEHQWQAIRREVVGCSVGFVNYNHGRRFLWDREDTILDDPIFGLGDNIMNVPQHLRSNSSNLQKLFIYATFSW